MSHESSYDSDSDIERDLFEGGPPGAKYGEDFVNPDGTFYDVYDDEEDKVRAYMLKVARSLGFDLNSMSEENPVGTCADWLKSVSPYVRVAGYVGMTTMTLALLNWNVSSDLWPLIPSFLYAVHEALTRKKRIIVDALLLLSLSILTLQFLRATVPSDTELYDVCQKYTGEFRCQEALKAFQSSTNQVLENTELLLENKPVDTLIFEGVPTFDSDNLKDIGNNIAFLSYRITEMSALAAYMYAFARRGGNIQRLLKAKGWFSTFFALTSIKSFMESIKIFKMSDLMYTMANLCVKLQIIMRFVVEGTRRGFSKEMLSAIILSASKSSPFLQHAEPVKWETMSNVITVIWFLLVIFYFVVRYINRY